MNKCLCAELSLGNAPEYTRENEPNPASSKLERQQQAQTVIRAIFRVKLGLFKLNHQHLVFPGTLNPTRLQEDSSWLGLTELFLPQPPKC